MYTAEDYIKFIETGRFDKISNEGLKLIVEKYRELESDLFVQKYQNGSGYSDRGYTDR